MRPLRLLALAACSAAFALAAGCGGDDGGGGGGTAFPREDADLVVVAHDLGFDADAYDAGAGELGVFYANDGAVQHTLLVEDGAGETVEGFKLEVQSNGDEDAGTVTLEAGEYVLYCDVPGHRAAGMEASLTVS